VSLPPLGTGGGRGTEEDTGGSEIETEPAPEELPDEPVLFLWRIAADRMEGIVMDDGGTRPWRVFLYKTCPQHELARTFQSRPQKC
jgi:hypothetical protein